MVVYTLAAGSCIIFFCAVVGAFSLASIDTTSRQRPLQTPIAFKRSSQEVEWTSLTDDGGVKMQVISDGGVTEGQIENLRGKDVTVEYIGSIAARDWGVEDVIACWLPDQGLPSLAPELFRAFGIDSKRLTNSTKFSVKFIREGLGILKDAKQTTLFEAAQDLKRSEQTHMYGTIFDKNQFTFRPGKGQVIRAFDLAITKMKIGQTVSLVARSDYAYGSKGLRVMGNVLVPPYATVQYNVTLVEVK